MGTRARKPGRKLAGFGPSTKQKARPLHKQPIKSLITKGATPMDTIPEKKKAKRPSQGKRKHIRRMKQEARKTDVTEAELKKRVRRS